MTDAKLDMVRAAWDDAEVRVARLEQEVARQQRRCRRAWRAAAAVAVLAVGVGGGWAVDRAGGGVDAVMAEEVRAGLARWADLLERGVHAKITDADLRAASVDPDGTGIKRLLAQLPTVREDYDVAPVRLVRDVSLEHCCMPLFP